MWGMNRIELSNNLVIAVDLSGQTLTLSDVTWKIESESCWTLPIYNSRAEAVGIILNTFRFGKPTLFTENTLSESQKNSALTGLEAHFPYASGLSAFMTSGSTGHPKLVIHENSSLLKAADAISRRYSKSYGSLWHHLFPSFYMAGILNCTLVPLLSGGRILIDDSFSFVSPLNVGLRSKKFNSQMAWLSPVMITSIGKSSGLQAYVNPNWKFILSATGKLSTESRDMFETNTGIPIFNTYGTTEQLFIASETNKSDEVTCGLPFDYVSIDLKSENLVIYSETSALAVLDWDQESRSFLRQFREIPNTLMVQDRGELVNGLLKIHGRSDSVVVLGGLNISLFEIERIVNQISGVIDSCAVAIDGGSIRDLTIFIERFDTDAAELSSIKSILYDSLGESSMPRKIILGKLPRTSTGKIDRNQLQKRIVRI
jgi:acyl-coenzyme A synthetase/AMP-(fatty) acid ligase